MTDRYFILDSDIGSDIDDAMALLLCLRLQDFPLVAITTVYNCVELRARIAKKMLMLENREVPVGIGVGKASPSVGIPSVSRFHRKDLRMKVELTEIEDEKNKKSDIRDNYEIERFL